MLILNKSNWNLFLPSIADSLNDTMNILKHRLWNMLY